MNALLWAELEGEKNTEHLQWYRILWSVVLEVADGKSSCINNEDSHRVFTDASKQPSEVRVKGFYDYLCQEETEKCSCLLCLSQVYCAKKKKTSPGHKNSTEDIL